MSGNPSGKESLSGSEVPGEQRDRQDKQRANRERFKGKV